MATQADLDLYNQMGGAQTPVQHPDIASEDSQLYDSIQASTSSSAPTQYDETGSPLENKQQILGRRLSSRPDMLEVGGQAIENDPLGAMFNPLTMTRNALFTAGGVLQKVTDAIAAPVNELTGQTVNSDASNKELGDVGVGLGMPEIIADTVGLISDPSARIIGLNRGLEKMGEAAAVLFNNIRKAGIKKALPLTANILLNKPVSEMEHLVNNPSALTKEALKPDAPQKLANEISRNMVAIQRKGTRLYQAAARDAQNTPVYTGMANDMADSLEGILAKEGDIAHQQKILGLPLGYTTKESVKPAVYKVGTKEVYYPGKQPSERAQAVADELGVEAKGTPSQHYTTDYNSETVGGAKTGEATTVKNTDAGPVLKKVITVKESTSRDATQSKAVYKLGDLIADVRAGKPVTMSQLVSVRDKLQGLRGESGTAGQMSDVVLDYLGQIDPKFAKAASTWSDYKRAENYAEQLFGGIVKDSKASDRANRVLAITGAGDKLSTVHTNPASPMAAAPGELDAIFARNLKTSPNYTNRVKDIAAVQGMNDIRPKLFGTTIASSLAVGIGGLGASAALFGAGKATDNKALQAASVLPILALGLGSPRVNTWIIQSLVDKKIMTPAAGKYLGSPAGKFLQDTAQRVKSGVGAATGNATRNAVIRQSTGMNDTVPTE